MNKDLIVRETKNALASDYLRIQYKFHTRNGGYSDGCVLNKAFSLQFVDKINWPDFF